MDRMPTTPIKTAMVVEEKLITWVDRKKDIINAVVFDINIAQNSQFNIQYV